MHTLVFGTYWVDHRNGDGLNNRRQNLRRCTNAENQQITDAWGGSSRFKGVSWYKRHSRWRGMFNRRGQTHFVGYFDDEVDAARAYNAAILPLAGRVRRLNAV